MLDNRTYVLSRQLGWRAERVQVGRTEDQIFRRRELIVRVSVTAAWPELV